MVSADLGFSSSLLDYFAFFRSYCSSRSIFSSLSFELFWLNPDFFFSPSLLGGSFSRYRSHFYLYLSFYLSFSRYFSFYLSLSRSVLLL